VKMREKTKGKELESTREMRMEMMKARQMEGTMEPELEIVTEPWSVEGMLEERLAQR
jgi:hypothetical protein